MKVSYWFIDHDGKKHTGGTARFKREYRGRPCEGPVRLTLRVVRPRPKTCKNAVPTSRPDLDNYMKLVCDALNGVVWKDDSQVVAAFVRKQYTSPDMPQPGYLITVESVEGKY